MSLAGANAATVFAEGKSLFVTGRHDVLKLRAGKGRTMTANGLQQSVHVYPAGAIESDPNAFRFMPQNEAKELAHAGCFFIGHIVKFEYVPSPSANLEVW